MTFAGTHLRTGNPYVGPTSFRDGDTLYGRDREREDLVDLLVAERIVLLYSPSGAGKTSLLQAALIPALRRDGFEVPPVIRVSHTLEPPPGVPSPANRYVTSVLLSLEERLPPEQQRPIPDLAALTLKEYLQSYIERSSGSGHLVLIFDQFEEILTADPTDEPAKHEFFTELGHMLRDRGQWALFSMREDFLAALDPYLAHLPTRLRTTFRLDLLSVDEALQAMRRPAADAGATFGEEAAQQLVDDLRTVRVQRPNGISKVLGSYVEPVQLQVACHLLWSMLPTEAREITRTDVDGLGRVDQALADYYAERVRMAAERTGVPERIIRDWFEERLITPQELRSQVLEGPIPSGQVGQHLLNELLDAHLIRAETRRQATWYELAHDRLVDPVRSDNAAWRVQHLSSFERAAALWEQEGRPDRLLLLGDDLAAAELDDAVRNHSLRPRQLEFLAASRRADEQRRHEQQTGVVLRRSARRLRITVALTTLLAMIAAASYVKSGSAQHAAEMETWNRLLVNAERSIDLDHPLGVALAAKAAEREDADDHAADVQRVLYKATESPVDLVLSGQAGPTQSAYITNDGSTVVTVGAKDIQLWDRVTGQPRERADLHAGEVVNTMIADDDASTVIAGLRNGTVLVWKVGLGDPTRWETGWREVWSVALSPDGTRIAGAGYSEVARIWDLDGNVISELPIPDAILGFDVAFSPDGRRLAVSSDAPMVTIWDPGTAKQVGSLPLPKSKDPESGSGGALFIGFGADSNKLATITTDAVTVWDPTTGSSLATLDRSPSDVYANFNRDLTHALTVDSNGTVTVYDLATGSDIARATAQGADLCCAGFDVEPSRVFVIANGNDPSFWRLTSATKATAAVVAEGNLFSTWDDGELRRWDGDSDTGAEDVMVDTGSTTITQLAADANGHRLVSLTSWGLVQVWDAQTGAELNSLDFLDWRLHEPQSAAVDLMPGGDEILIADSGGGVTRWDVESGKNLGNIVESSERDIAVIEVSADGTTALLSYGPPDTSASLDTRSGGDAEPAAMLVSLTDADTEPIILGLPRSDDHPTEPEDSRVPETVTAADFTGDGRKVVVGTSNGRVAEFDATSGELYWVGVMHQRAVTQVLVDESTKDLVTVSRPLAESSAEFTGSTDDADMSQVILLSGDGDRGRTVPSTSPLMAAMKTPDGQHLTMLTTDGPTRTVPLNDDELLQQVRSNVTYTLTDSDCEYFRIQTDC